ncbi:pitrilysin family protein [uncultured Dokdonia sp.]|uniref:M16 family metallopeptidase n=1 Tax=uncultured Dokdonia sp. TaxID=575653 RepID=UPI00261C4F72|nr:pitrilysin family protein [uncultured Dokdonia sp.]
MKVFRLLILLCGVSVISSCEEDKTTTITEESKEFNVPFEKFTLDNGLTVLLHKDTSDPVVAVALTTHVGSAREIEGRTGFAHLFEHLLFLESENLGKGGLDKMSARIGGSGANGSTSRDRTNYFQTVPKDALEKMIWAEADKLGWFINTVTDPVLAKEKQVVKNEKRQGVDNRPYGHVEYVIDKNLYPEGHPYSWQVIGSLEDLQNATLQDVKDFYNRWYTPNNTVLTIAGDFDTAQTKAWVHKYFDEIKRGEKIPSLEKPTITVSETKKLYYEDNFARVPQLTMTWPTVPLYHKDSYALDMLARYLSDGKQAPFNVVLIDDKQLTSNVRMSNYASELAGQYRIQVRAFNGKDLDEVSKSIDNAFAKFESEGIPQSAIDRIKAGQETNFYNSLSSVLGKGFQLAQYEIFANDPGFIAKDIENILAVTTEDVMQVYNKYIKGKNYIATSFVPNGQVDLALESSTLAEVVEEKIVEGAEESFDASVVASYEKTPSSFDRSIEPAYGNSPSLTIPEVWQTTLSSGIKVYGIENKEVPLVQFQLSFDGGLLLENPEKVGVSNLMAQLMTKGTATKTTAELEEAIEGLGASINVFAGNESVVVTGNTLAKNYEATIALVEEIILQPRWDKEEFDIIKQSVMNQIVQQQASPNRIATNEYAKLIYGDTHILSHNQLGTLASVTTITLEDLKAFYKNLSPTVGNMYVVGDVQENTVVSSLEKINENMVATEIVIPTYEMPERPAQSKVYFYNVPGAKQSVLRFGYPALAATDPDYYPARVMNYRLGGGGFASQFTQQLREGKGYTYGIRSGFSGTALPGSFTISSGVRSNVTYESAALVKQILANYGENFSEEDLEVSKSFLIKSNARAFETSGAKLGMLSNISELNLPVDYAKQREARVKEMTVADIKALSAKYLDPDKMIYLVVGDAKTQLKKLEQLGYGTPVLLNPKEEIKK